MATEVGIPIEKKPVAPTTLRSTLYSLIPAAMMIFSVGGITKNPCLGLTAGLIYYATFEPTIRSIFRDPEKYKTTEYQEIVSSPAAAFLVSLLANRAGAGILPTVLTGTTFYSITNAMRDRGDVWGKHSHRVLPSLFGLVGGALITDQLQVASPIKLLAREIIPTITFSLGFFRQEFPLAIKELGNTFADSIRIISFHTKNIARAAKEPTTLLAELGVLKFKLLIKDLIHR